MHIITWQIPLMTFLGLDFSSVLVRLSDIYRQNRSNKIWQRQKARYCFRTATVRVKCWRRGVFVMCFSTLGNSLVCENSSWKESFQIWPKMVKWPNIYFLEENLYMFWILIQLLGGIFAWAFKMHFSVSKTVHPFFCNKVNFIGSKVSKVDLNGNPQNLDRVIWQKNRRMSQFQ